MERLSTRWAVFALVAALPFTLVLAPIASFLVLSFFRVADNQIVREVSLVNYVNFFGSPTYWGTFLGTLWLCLEVMVFAIAIGYPVAWFVWRRRGRSRYFLLLLTVLPLFMSYIVKLYTLRSILGLNGLLNQALLGLNLLDKPSLLFLYNQRAVLLTMTIIYLPFAEWKLPLDVKAAIDHLLSHERLDATERSPLGSATNTETLIAALEGLAQRTDKQTKLLERIKGYPGHSITGKAQAILSPHLPSFMYFSHYDRMSGQVRVDQLKQWRDNKELERPDKAGERVFLDFLSFAGTTLEEVLDTKTYESLNARCEAASSKITRQVFEYWKQNRFLAIEVRVTKAEPNDPPPFNEGVIVRARVKNKVHEVTVPFSERSAGFIWFFSFLVKFAQVQKSPGEVILLLDEPGLSLHGKAQADLLRYFAEKLEPKHQVIYSTHSPFMVAPDRLLSVRIVEDVVREPDPQSFISEGTKVREDVLAVGGAGDPDSLFPLQGALGYEVSQSLFVGAHTLLVEGPSDILYVQALSDELKRRKRVGLDARWTLCPSGGIDKIQPFVSLFAGNRLHVAVLTDQGPNDKSKLERLRMSQVLQAGHVHSVAEFAGKPEADIEDLFEPGLFVAIVNSAYALPKKHTLTVASLDAADQSTPRLVKKAEAAFRVLPESVPTYDHFTPAAWLIRNLEALQGADDAVSKTLDRAEAAFQALNALLPKT